MNITPHLSKTIKAILKSYVANPEPQLVKLDPPLDLQKLANDLNLLPMLIDMGGCYGIRPNGDILSLAWDEPYNLHLESDTRICNIVLFQGSKKYPELAALVPTRPARTVDCPHCHGTGAEPFSEKLSAEHGLNPEFVCYCGGLGWLPESPGDDLYGWFRPDDVW